MGLKVTIELPEAVLALLDINDDTVIESYVDGNRLIVRSISEDEAKQAGF